MLQKLASVKIAFVGDFLYRGKSLQAIGTSIVLLLSKLEKIEKIDVYSPFPTEEVGDFRFPAKVTIIESYNYDEPRQILNLVRLRKKDYDKIIFNIVSTTFGNKNMANLAGLLVPLLLGKLSSNKEIEVIYHNSAFLNDIAKLGYTSIFDKARAFFLKVLERQIFKSIRTFMLLNFYKEKIDEIIGTNKVTVLDGAYLEAIPTLFLNNAEEEESIQMSPQQNVPTLLIHGTWGPQKNLELGLRPLRKLKEENYQFKLIISGGINHHFSDYERNFIRTLENYKDIITSYLGRVAEVDLMELFLKTDLLVLPYNTPGGHSGVLEQGIFFNIPTVAMDFPEYREQSHNTDNVRLAKSEDEILALVRENLLKIENSDRNIKIMEKVNAAIEHIKVLIK